MPTYILTGRMREATMQGLIDNPEDRFQAVINKWLRQYNRIRPHHALGMRPQAPETILEKRSFGGIGQRGLDTVSGVVDPASRPLIP